MGSVLAPQLPWAYYLVQFMAVHCHLSISIWFVRSWTGDLESLELFMVALSSVPQHAILLFIFHVGTPPGLSNWDGS